jgi:hypothetical protein
VLSPPLTGLASTPITQDSVYTTPLRLLSFFCAYAATFQITTYLLSLFPILSWAPRYSTFISMSAALCFGSSWWPLRPRLVYRRCYRWPHSRHSRRAPGHVLCSGMSTILLSNPLLMVFLRIARYPSSRIRSLLIFRWRLDLLRRLVLPTASCTPDEIIIFSSFLRQPRTFQSAPWLSCP